MMLQTSGERYVYIGTTIIHTHTHTRESETSNLHVGVLMKSSKLVVHADKQKRNTQKVTTDAETQDLHKFNRDSTHLSPPRMSAVFSPVNFPS